LLKTVLQKKGYTVICGVDGEDGYLAAKESHGSIDLLLTDVVLPRLSGKALYKRLRSHSPHLRVLFMSGYADNDISRQDPGDANAHFISKPFDPAALLAKVAKALSPGP
ncbi:response regulator, partial [Myxococcota bacterium]|nr:response regulator [Myxococcota bacterium]